MERRRPIDVLIHPFQVFASHKLAGAALLMAAAVVAVVWANSPWHVAYREILSLPVRAGAGDFTLEKPLVLWINDGLMGVFFFLVGLEIKREVMAGELSTRRKAALPAIAAVGGMIVPAAIYAAFNVGGSGQAGWGIPMATDIAFALGVLALLGDRIPVGLKVFLTALAIVDDIGAVLVIAVFYTDAVSFVSLGTGAALYALAILLRFLQMRSSVVYFIVGTAVWLAFLKSGVHATIAALLMAFIIPSTTRIDGAALLGRLDEYIRRIRRAGVPGDRRMNTAEQQHVLDEMVVDIVHASSPLLRLEHALVPVAAFLVLPIFALANAGVSVGAGELLVALTDPIALGTIVGLFVGKQVGVALFTWVAVKAGLADLPANVSWRQVYGVATLAGVGFTMSLFISGLAFTEALNDIAKVGILAGSILSGLVGWMILRPAGRGAAG